MLHKAFSFVGVLALGGAAALWTAGPASAAGHGGGGHFGGARIGGFHGGFSRGGFSHNGFGHGFGYRPSYGYHHYSNGYRPYYGSYGYYPYYGAYGYTPYYGSDSYYPSYSFYESDLGSDSALQVPGGSYAPATASYSGAVLAPPDGTARLTATVPAGAEIWVDGEKTAATGSVREYQSPPLTPGKRYGYEVRDRWSENGHEVTQTQEVEVNAGAHVRVSFPVPPKAAGHASAVQRP